MNNLNANANLNIKEKQYYRDADGRIIINMNVNDDAEFLSVFSSNDIPVISSSVADFLEKITYSISPDEQLHLQIKSQCIDETEQEIYKNAIKEYYIEKYCVNEREIKKQNKISLMLAVVGILVLAFAVFLDYRIESIIWSEVVDIAAWVFLWESVDIKFFKTRELALQRKRYKALATMKIEYLK